jgi:hypothetical protein
MHASFPMDRDDPTDPESYTVIAHRYLTGLGLIHLTDREFADEVDSLVSLLCMAHQRGAADDE